MNIMYKPRIGDLIVVKESSLVWKVSDNPYSPLLRLMKPEIGVITARTSGSFAVQILVNGHALGTSSVNLELLSS